MTVGQLRSRVWNNHNLPLRLKTRVCESCVLMYWVAVSLCRCFVDCETIVFIQINRLPSGLTSIANILFAWMCLVGASNYNLDLPAVHTLQEMLAVVGILEAAKQEELLIFQEIKSLFTGTNACCTLLSRSRKFYSLSFITRSTGGMFQLRLLFTVKTSCFIYPRAIRAALETLVSL